MTGADDGLVVVDKPAGWTSHDVVARVRRLAGTRRVGHAGTLDPLATGVLLLGVGKATRLLGHLALTDKAYDATIRLGVATLTDDAEGEAVARADASGVTAAMLDRSVAALTGPLQQVPSAVSAVKVDGRRAYARVRAGEQVELAPRAVLVRTFDVVSVRADGTVLDVDVRVECSSGTYVRALARDLGGALGVGGHLVALRRTRVGPYDLSAARTVDELAGEFVMLPLAAAVASDFPRLDVDAETARRVGHGVPFPATGLSAGPVGVFDPGGALLALVQDSDDRANAPGRLRRMSAVPGLNG